MTKDTPNRVPKSNVVEGTLPVLVEGNPDTFFLAPNKYLKVKDGAVNYDNYLTSISGISSPLQSQPDLNSLVSSSKLTTNPIIKIDTVDLTDIESITYEQYYDSIAKVIKYKAILKIRNSSPNKTEVQGVDARIYNPNA